MSEPPSLLRLIFYVLDTQGDSQLEDLSTKLDPGPHHIFLTIMILFDISEHVSAQEG
jgi:hypothetical protein